jgi:hypothetical protein
MTVPEDQIGRFRICLFSTQSPTVAVGTTITDCHRVAGGGRPLSLFLKRGSSSHLVQAGRRRER